MEFDVQFSKSSQDIKRSDLKAICETVGVPVFRDIELDFNDEYVEVLAPIAIALDRLQGQTNESISFMGY